MGNGMENIAQRFGDVPMPANDHSSLVGRNLDPHDKMKLFLDEVNPYGPLILNQGGDHGKGQIMQAVAAQGMPRRLWAAFISARCSSLPSGELQ